MLSGVPSWIDASWRLLGFSKVYSATEADTGDIWIDGKPIYRRCFTGNIVAAANTMQNVTLINSGVDSLISSGGWIQMGGASGSKISINNSTAQGTFPQMETENALYVGNQQLMLQTTSIAVRSGTTNNAYQIWVEYTKV